MLWNLMAHLPFCMMFCFNWIQFLNLYQSWQVSWSVGGHWKRLWCSQTNDLFDWVFTVTMKECTLNQLPHCWVPGISRGLHCGQLAPRWTTPLLANPRNPAMSPTCPDTRHTDLVSDGEKSKLKKKIRGREGWVRKTSRMLQNTWTKQAATAHHCIKTTQTEPDSTWTTADHQHLITPCLWFHSGQTQKTTSLSVFQSLEGWISSDFYEREVQWKRCIKCLDKPHFAPIKLLDASYFILNTYST